jgi:hypothetical protein
MGAALIGAAPPPLRLHASHPAAHVAAGFNRSI